MAIDEERIKAFVDESELRQRVATVLRHAGFTIAWVVEQDSGSRWGMYLKLPPKLRELFATGREILVWVVQSREFQARTVTQAVEQLDYRRPRLCEDFAIVATHDGNTGEHAAETGSTYNTIFVGFSLDEFKNFAPLGGQDFVKSLQARLYSRDLYDMPGAVTRSQDFFGRREMITEIATRLRQGSRHIGIFGLRKIGKTSLLYRLQSTLASNKNVEVIYIDVERIDAINPTAEYLIWSIGESLYDASRHIRQIPNLALFGKYRLFAQATNEGDLFECFDNDLRAVLKSTNKTLVLMLDEVELLSPDAPGSQWEGAFVRVWRLLRGIDQQFPGRLSFFVTGTNPQVFERNYLAARENPAYNYFSIEYLKPLHANDVNKLLTGLGKRMGLYWRDEAIDRVIEATGGHPALVRALASLIHRMVYNKRFGKNSDSLVDYVTRVSVEDAIRRFFEERTSLLSQIVAVLDEQYPDEYWLLGLLASGRIGEFREYANGFPEDTAHLLGYGLCSSPSTCNRIEIELLQSFIQRRPAYQKEVAIGRAGLRPGDAIGDYRIVSAIGHVSGFAQVYSALDSDGRTVALKVFNSALLTVLQRELEPLQDISHTHVLDVLDFGKSESGLVYMVSEYLEGVSLRYYCTKTTRASTDEVVRWLHDLLSAFIEFHPNDRAISKLREAPELSEEQLAELEEARHGFIHRDVKPENVIVSSRGPVLIDFNISSRASAPVITMSSTPGYQPPDGVGVSWAPDVDLYQLGVTMLQVALGLEYSGDDISDLRTLAYESLDDGLARFLNKMTAPEYSERFSSAMDALRSVEQLPQMLGSRSSLGR